MTVKLTNFFSSNAAAITHATITPGTTMTPPTSTPIMHSNVATNAIDSSYQLQQQQQKQLPAQQQQSYNPYLAVNDADDSDLYDDDNMSLYSNATSASGIMTQRSHSCNNSQRPLLGERKPPKMLLLNSSNGTKKNKKSSTSASPSSSNGFNQAQRHLQQKQRQQGKPQMLQQSKSYISPYVQQQKRDSAKGLHGFNDFDILSQQYTEHLRSSPHIGYPYGSPPSPTAKSNDFVFDTLLMPQQKKQQPQQQQEQQQHLKYSSQQIVGNDTNATDYSYYANTPCNGNASSSGNSSGGSGSASVGSLGHLTTVNHAIHSYHRIGKPSRFEDDFCTKRNATFAAPQTSSAAQSQHQQQQQQELVNKAWSPTDDIGGPFIFGGVPHERLPKQQLEQGNGVNKPQRDSNNSPLPLATNSTDSALDVSDQYSPYIGQVIVQSSSDTSSSSRDSNSNKGAKFLLRKGKSKRNTKDKKAESSAVQVKVQQQKQHETSTIKCVLVGDGAVGKTNLILSYLKNRFNTEHVPTASDIYNADVLVNDSPVRLTICDTAGQDTLDKLRQLCYPDSDVFLLCFSVVKPNTFNAVKMKWAPKFSKTKAALLLVGTQADLRNDAQVLNKLQLNGEKPISYADAWDLAASIGAKYIETSSATQDKVKEVFDTAIWEGLAPTTLPPTPMPPLWKRLLCLA